MRSDLTESMQRDPSHFKALNKGSPGRLSPFIWLKLESFGRNLRTEISKMGLQCHSKPIPSKFSFSKLETLLPPKVKEIPRKTLGIESTLCRVEESIEFQSSLLSKILAPPFG